MEQTTGNRLLNFESAVKKMVSTNDGVYRGLWTKRMYRETHKTYSLEEVEKIIENGSIEEQRQLSRAYFERDGFYKRIIIHYATICLYSGVLIPHFKNGVKKNLQKKYNEALDFVESLDIPSFCCDCAIKALRDGCYYGLLVKENRNNYYVIDLPIDYCITRYKTLNGLDLIEFNVGYFDKIVDDKYKKATLKAYPQSIQQAYKKYEKGKLADPWILIPESCGICFPMFGNAPLFLATIPATINYDKAVEREEERELEEIRKIIVQKIPHNTTTDALLFEPEEAAVIHEGTVKMMKGNKNVSVLTTYADVDAITSKTSSDTVSNNLEKMAETIYFQAGTSSQLFSSTGSSTLDASIKNDFALIRPFINKVAKFLTAMVNDLYGSSTLTYKYIILPITAYNTKEYVEDTLKLANGGYSHILPTLAVGLSQRDILDLKDLENHLLKMDKYLIPLKSAFTQSSKATEEANKEDKKEAGGQEVPEEEKSEKTLQNQESLDNQG